MTLMEKEIREEPSRLNDTDIENQDKIAEISKTIHNRAIKQIIIAARGSSDNAGNYFKYLCETVAGIPVGFAAPSIITLYNGKLDLSQALTIAISQSGQAMDALAVVEQAKRQGGMTIAITNDTQSPLAKTADYHLYLNVGQEKSIAATKSFIAQMYILAMLVEGISQDETLNHEIKKIGGLIQDTINMSETIAIQSLALLDAKDCFVLGRGFNNAIAHEFALKLQETTYIKALGYATSDFYHGPFAMIEQQSKVIILMPKDNTMPGSLEMIKKLEAIGAQIIIFTDDSSLKYKNQVVLPKAHEYLSPFVFVVAAQIFVCNLSQKRGVNPDQPRGLKKITITK
ncbi:MAG: SIS domain-containing protein [Candidatus Izemoplasmatales bacterium]|nr:SIS domain-containing protein [Candidatus Izemoplasmatales bacterium]MDD3865212.1 SIS domain-containing protein [Candidatus Izemoplasmatales bacterium]